MSRIRHCDKLQYGCVTNIWTSEPMPNLEAPQMDAVVELDSDGGPTLEHVEEILGLKLKKQQARPLLNMSNDEDEPTFEHCKAMMGL